MRAPCAPRLPKPVEALDARLDATPIDFTDLPPIGSPGAIVSAAPLGVLDIERIEFANGVVALVWPTEGEPGRVNVRARFGAGRSGFTPATAPYAAIGESALVGAGQGELGQEELDRLATGRKLGFDLEIADTHFAFAAQTRSADLADQLYLFAAKLADPRWDPNPVRRAIAASELAYGSFAASPGGLLQRDLEALQRGGDPRYATPDPETLASLTPEGFRAAWEPLLRQGPLEIMVFGDFARDEAVAALTRTFGALPPREPLSAAARNYAPGEPGEPVVLRHRGDAEQAAALIAWPTGGGLDDPRTARELEVVAQLFGNRLLDEMRERAGASYAPQAGSAVAGRAGERRLRARARPAAARGRAGVLRRRPLDRRRSGDDAAAGRRARPRHRPAASAAATRVDRQRLLDVPAERRDGGPARRRRAAQPARRLRQRHARTRV